LSPDDPVPHSLSVRRAQRHPSPWSLALS